MVKLRKNAAAGRYFARSFVNRLTRDGKGAIVVVICGHMPIGSSSE
jgi:hypothetical protein